MDHEPLNTGEQKDMTEFFTDLISKVEEMGPDLKVSYICYSLTSKLNSSSEQQLALCSPGATVVACVFGSGW